MKQIKVLISWDEPSTGEIHAEVVDGQLVGDKHALIYDGVMLTYAKVKQIYGHVGMYSIDAEFFEMEVERDFDLEKIKHYTLSEFLLSLAANAVYVRNMNA